MNDLVAVKPQTGEIVESPAPAPQLPAVNPYEGAAQVPITPEESAALLADFPDSEFLVRPDDGIVYLSHDKLRRRLTTVLGVGQWAMVPAGAPLLQEEEQKDPTKSKTSLVMQTWRLVIRGAFAAEATGDAKYIHGNAKMTYGDVLESVKSNALTRLCKALDVGTQAWDASWREAWSARYVQMEWRQNKRTGKNERVFSLRQPFESFRPSPASPPPQTAPAPQPEASRPAPAPQPMAEARSSKADPDGAVEWERVKVSAIYENTLKSGARAGQKWWNMPGDGAKFTLWDRKLADVAFQAKQERRDVEVQAEPLNSYGQRKVLAIRIAALAGNDSTQGPPVGEVQPPPPGDDDFSDSDRPEGF